jgi:hypothetical protein
MCPATLTPPLRPSAALNQTKARDEVAADADPEHRGVETSNAGRGNGRQRPITGPKFKGTY